MCYISCLRNIRSSPCSSRPSPQRCQKPKICGNSSTDSPSILTMVLTILLGQVIFPGLCRVVIHSQYLSINGIISCGNRKHLCELLLADTSTGVSPAPSSQTLSLENMVLGCSSCVLDCQVRLARALRHISFRSERQNSPGGKIRHFCTQRPPWETAKPPKFCPQPSLKQLNHLQKLVAKHF